MDETPAFEITQRDPMRGDPSASTTAESEAERDPDRPVFYFDLGSVYAYLAAERISRLFSEENLTQPEWQPILLGGLFKAYGRSSWMLGPEREEGMRECERRAEEYGLMPIVWPDPVPGNTLYAMRVATYAKGIGRSVSFALAAFRQAFAGGRDLTDPDNVAIAAAACEMHPNAIAKAAASDGVKRQLIEATERAGELGVRGVPSVRVRDQVFWGDDRLEEAVAAARALG
jgi:2-hydroxychromene-2-carboxylate isomerase